MVLGYQGQQCGSAPVAFVRQGKLTEAFEVVRRAPVDRAVPQPTQFEELRVRAAGGPSWSAAWEQTVAASVVVPERAGDVPESQCSDSPDSVQRYDPAMLAEDAALSLHPEGAAMV